MKQAKEVDALYIHKKKIYYNYFVGFHSVYVHNITVEMINY